MRDLPPLRLEEMSAVLILRGFQALVPSQSRLRR